MDDVTNYFVHRSAAQRYAAARPYFHPLIVQKIISFTGESRFSRALDVASGTGQSSLALSEIAVIVDAIDVSPEMVAEAKPHDRIRNYISLAEALPFPDGAFSLATVGLAFHWFNQTDFLREVHRVLKPDAWLVIYTSGFSGEMVEDSTFREWARNFYPKRFPTPPRRSHNFAVSEVKSFGFALGRTESFTHNEKMDTDQLADYLLTQTNVIAAVEEGIVPLSEAKDWISDGIKPVFKDQVRTMKFTGSISFLHRTGAA